MVWPWIFYYVKWNFLNFHQNSTHTFFIFIIIIFNNKFLQILINILLIEMWYIFVYIYTYSSIKNIFSSIKVGYLFIFNTTVRYVLNDIRSSDWSHFEEFNIKIFISLDVIKYTNYIIIIIYFYGNITGNIKHITWHTQSKVVPTT